MQSIIVDEVEFRFFNHLYAVSRAGKVLRKLSPYIPKVRPDGYLEASHNGLVHRLVAICWLERPEGAKIVHHKDHDRTNNHADNLEWMTQKQHIAEKHPHNARGHVVTAAHRLQLRLLRLGTKDPENVRLKKADILRRVSVRKCACEVNGVEYRSFLSASKALGIHFHTVRYRCLSKNFPNYRLVTRS